MIRLVPFQAVAQYTGIPCPLCKGEWVEHCEDCGACDDMEHDNVCIYVDSDLT